MTPRNQIIMYAKHTISWVRMTYGSRHPVRLMVKVNDRLKTLWDMGCHSDDLSNGEKELCRRIVPVIEQLKSRGPLPCGKYD